LAKAARQICDRALTQQIEWVRHRPVEVCKCWFAIDCEVGGVVLMLRAYPGRRGRRTNQDLVRVEDWYELPVHLSAHLIAAVEASRAMLPSGVENLHDERAHLVPPAWQVLFCDTSEEPFPRREPGIVGATV